MQVFLDKMSDIYPCLTPHKTDIRSPYSVEYHKMFADAIMMLYAYLLAQFSTTIMQRIYFTI